MRTVILEDIELDGKTIKRGTVLGKDDKRLPKIREQLYSANLAKDEDKIERTTSKVLEAS